MKIIIFTDGGSRGNPGPGGAGAVVRDKVTNETIFEQSAFLGTVTNNEAEYQALLLALAWLWENHRSKHIEAVEFYLDSKLVVEQLNKKWKIKDERMKVLAQKSWDLLQKIALPYSFTHVRREKNQRADALVNQVLDARG